MKRLITIIVAMCVAVSAFAQNTNIKLTLIDASTGEGVPFATVSITPEGATKASKYVLTTEKGAATIDGVKKGNYTVKAELLGYKPFSQEVKAEGRTLDLGEVKMEVDTEVLDAASVSAVGNPIVVKKDTVEYNATMFRTTDSDMLIDLLKKLPGIEVGSDGSVKANGKSIDKITIDGKTFFLDDPQLATQNLPAKLIEKVKVVEKKSDQAIFTGIDDGEEENIIDLTVKPGMMNGWFGNLTAGGGYDMTAEALTAKGKTTKEGEAGDAGWDHARFSLNSMVGNFKEKGQIALILNANNANRQGFGGGGGMGGGMMGGGGFGGGRGGGSGSSLGLSGSGITTSWMAGVNGAYNFLDDDMEFAGDYVYNGSTNHLESDNYKEAYQTNGNTNFYKTVGTRDNFSQGHRIGIRLDYKISENTSFLFEPQVNYNYGNSNTHTVDNTWMGLTGSPFESATALNSGFSDNDTKNNSWSTSGRFLLRQKLGKPGRTMTLSARYSFSQNNNDGFNQSLSQSYGDAGTRNAVTNQYAENKSNSYSVRTEATYTEPLAQGLYLETSYQYNWSKSLSNKDSYDLDPQNDYSSTTDIAAIRSLLGDYRMDFLNHDYMSDDSWRTAHYNSIYSNSIDNQTQTHRAGLLLQYQNSGLRLQVGGAYQPTITDNTTTGSDPYHHVDHNWSPRARIEYEFNDNTDFFINYTGRSSQPSTSELLPVPDNSNPLAVSFGNPYLTSSFSHNLNGRFGYTNRQTYTSVNAFANASMNQNGISNATWTDSKGVNYSMPLNGKLTGSASLGMFIYTPIAKSNFSINNMMNVSYSASKAYVGRAEKTQLLLDKYYNPETAEFKYQDFHRDFFENGGENLLDYFVDNTTTTLNLMENLSFTYRSDYVEATIGGSTNVNKPWYSKEMQKQQAAQWRNSANASFQWNTNTGFGLQTSMNYNWYVGYTTPQPDEWIWNAQISHTLFKRQATLTLLAYDILGQSRTLTVSDTSNYHQESRSNTLGRYVMLTFTWRFGTFGGRGGRGGFGGRGGMGGGRAPMGGGRPPMGGGMGGGRPF
ncbi:MAG: outer membrane beta-barrel protein [Bacteroidales bacterium]|nr:outer membrane beta-barrel protein [Bacteroidales bacterium]